MKKLAAIFILSIAFVNVSYAAEKKENDPIVIFKMIMPKLVEETVLSAELGVAGYADFSKEVNPLNRDKGFWYFLGEATKDDKVINDPERLKIKREELLKLLNAVYYIYTGFHFGYRAAFRAEFEKNKEYWELIILRDYTKWKKENN